MNYDPFQSAGYSLFGQKFSHKKCFEAADNFWDCLDVYNESEGKRVTIDNPYRCPEQHAQWSKVCDPYVQKKMLQDRQYNRENNLLYTQVPD